MLFRVASVVKCLVCLPPKSCGFEPGQGDGCLRAIKISSTPSSRMGSKAGRSHVVRFYGMLQNAWSPTGTDELNSHFLRQSPTRSRDVSGDGQSALVDKLGVIPSRSRLLRSTSLSPGDSTTGPRPQFWDVSLAPSQQSTYNLQATIMLFSVAINGGIQWTW
jgi:hypothetical protein